MALSAEWQEALAPCPCGPVDIIWPQFDIDPPDTLPIRVHDRQCEEVTGLPSPWETHAAQPEAVNVDRRIDSHFDRMAEQLAYREEQDMIELGGAW